MASVYIGLAQDDNNTDNAVSSLNTVVNDIRRSTDHLSEILKMKGLADRISRDAQEVKAASLHHLSQIRVIRDQLFGEDIFFDPSWSILLDLYQRELEGRRVMVSDACAASGVPSTTGLRWLRVLEKRNFVVRTQDPTDRRRVFVALTPVASKKMAEIANSLVRRFYEI
jgi:DNA-binding MarR family transcriptional regulator